MGALAGAHRRDVPRAPPTIRAVLGGGPGACRGGGFREKPLRICQFVPTAPEAEAETETETLIEASTCATAATAAEIWPLMHSA